jgi:electron transport complex protein RnfB
MIDKTADRPARKKVPREIAVIFADNCTGCQACVAVCPADCINTITVADGVKGTESWCEIDLDRCIGCRLCVRLPRRDKTDAHTMLVCPWEAIEMVPIGELEDAIARIGGRRDYAEKNRDRLADMATRQVQLATKARPTDSSLATRAGGGRG